MSEKVSFFFYKNEMETSSEMRSGIWTEERRKTQNRE